MSYIKLERIEDKKVAVITMDHGDNKLHPDFVDEMMETLDAIEGDDTTRAVVVTGGEPKYFCNGLDLGWLMAHVANPQDIFDYLVKVNGLFRRVTLFPKPTVAALNGHTFAAGLFLAAHMDFRYMREDRGWICMPEVDINIPLLPGMIAICQAIFTPSGFRQLYYTGQRFNGVEAMELGFVEKLCSAEELLPASIDLAADLAKKNTKTYAEMKRRVRGDIAEILEVEDPKHFMATLSFAMPG